MSDREDLDRELGDHAWLASQKMTEPEARVPETTIDGQAGVLYDLLTSIPVDALERALCHLVKHMWLSAAHLAASILNTASELAIAGSFFENVRTLLKPRVRALLANALAPSTTLALNSLTNIAVGATRTCTVTTSDAFQPSRYVVPATVAPDFVIESIDVGVDRILNQPIPAEAFGPNAIYSRIEVPVVPPAGSISVTVRNVGGVDRPFFSVMYGQRATAYSNEHFPYSRG